MIQRCSSTGAVRCPMVLHCLKSVAICGKTRLNSSGSPCRAKAGNVLKLLPGVIRLKFDQALTVRLNNGSPTLAKLGEIKLKQVPQLNTANSSPLIRKHKEVLNLMMRTFSLDTYGLSWMQFLKGFGLGGLAVWLLMR